MGEDGQNQRLRPCMGTEKLTSSAGHKKKGQNLEISAFHLVFKLENKCSNAGTKQDQSVWSCLPKQQLTARDPDKEVLGGGFGCDAPNHRVPAAESL